MKRQSLVKSRVGKKQLKQSIILTSTTDVTKLLCKNNKNNKGIDVCMVRCDDCLLRYNKYDPLQVSKHNEYHDLQTKGLKWSIPNFMKVCKIVHKNEEKYANLKNNYNVLQMMTKNSIPTPMSSQLHDRIKDSHSDQDECIVEIQPKHTQEVNLALKILEIVNEELTAPQNENAFWIENNGKCYTYIHKNRAVGIVTVEILNHSNHKMKWMILSSKQIVEHVDPTFLVGISRIWVSKQYRRQGIALKLLRAAASHVFDDSTPVKPLQMAWSQPSESGSHIAEKFNSVKHKSGELLIPVYL